MARYQLVDCCPTPNQLAHTLRLIKVESGCSYSSIYRGKDARALLERCGKHDQAWLWEHLGPGKANPPGRSTHELRSDGVAYRGPVGRPLRWWQCGIDVDDAHVQAFIEAARRHGWIATITYPGNPYEYHHVNFRKDPSGRIFHTIRILRVGSRGLRVRWVQKWLKALGYAKDLKVDGMFGPKTKTALMAFQKDYHMVADGVYGAATSAQLHVAIRRHKKS